MLGLFAIIKKKTLAAKVLHGIPKEKVFAPSKNPITGALRIAENKSMMCCLTKK